MNTIDTIQTRRFVQYEFYVVIYSHSRESPSNTHANNYRTLASLVSINPERILSHPRSRSNKTTDRFLDTRRLRHASAPPPRAIRIKSPGHADFSNSKPDGGLTTDCVLGLFRAAFRSREKYTRESKNDDVCQHVSHAGEIESDSSRAFLMWRGEKSTTGIRL